MKKCLVMLLAAALFVVAGCKKDSDKDKKMTFTSGLGGGAKTEINNHSMKWTTGDDIIVNGETFACEVKEEGARAEFTGKVVQSPYNAYYPTSIWNEGTPTLPSTQYYDENNLSRVSPMYAHSENTSLLFHNICALVKLNLKGIGTVMTITASADQSLSGEFTIAGNETDGYYANVLQLRDGAAAVTLDCGQGVALDATTPKAFYIALPQGEYTNLKFTVSNGTITKEVTMEENSLVAGTLYGIEKEVKLVADISVTGVSVSPTTLSLEVGATQQLTATVLPEDATNQNVTWSSNKESVATVAAAGTVTAVAAGTATITVTTVDGGKTATCVVTVIPAGALKGKFTIGSGKQVYFAKGNLRCNITTNPVTWSFEEHQYDYQTLPGSIRWDQFTNVSHFTWSATCSGSSTGSYAPYSSPYYSNSSSYNKFTEFFANTSSFPLHKNGGWYALSKTEWDYLLNTRSNASSLRGFMTVGGKYGMVILPDGSSLRVGTATWVQMEAEGAVFLPAAGKRNGTTYSGSGTGYYWTSELNDSRWEWPWRLTFSNGSFSLANQSEYPNQFGDFWGQSVRLVMDVPK